MINLFDDYKFSSQLLHNSLKLAGYNNYTVSLEDDGFLPEDVSSPYQFFANNTIKETDQALFFNEVNIPPFWEITGNNEMAEIKNLGEVRGKIFYRQHYKTRIVKQVEWLDNKQRLRSIDFYNRYGFKYAETVYDLAGTAIMKKYFDRDGKEVIYENFVTGDYILDWQGKSHFFNSEEAFIIFYLQQLNVDLSEVLFNSLAMPFIALYRMDEVGKGILVWQEHCKGNVPGNMKLMFNRQLNRQYSVIIPDHGEYNTIHNGVETSEQRFIHNGGYLYNYLKDNNYTKHVLTLTNSDQIANIEALIQDNTNYQFHIAAVTEMSNKLLDLAEYPNVHLYPVATDEVIEQLYEQCDIYLDINRGVELLDAVNRAFDYNMVIFAYHEVAHNKLFTAPENIALENEYANLTLMLQKMAKKKTTYKTRLQLQKDYANEVKPTAFINTLNKARK